MEKSLKNQDTFDDYPKAASDNAKRALAIRDEGGKTANCGTRVGWARANQLAKREAISRDTVARMASFNRHRQNSDGDPREKCGPLMWLAWGGDEGVNWAINKMEELRKENKAKALAVKLFTDIGPWTVQDFEEALSQSGQEELEVLINSPGGDVFEGFTIANLLIGRGNVTTTAVGLAASIASVILMAGDKVRMASGSMLMIHDAWAFEAGNAREMRKTAELLDKISNQIALIYTEQIAKNGKLIDGDKDETIRQVRQMMRAEKWLTAQEALELGLVDEIVNGYEEKEEEQEQEVEMFAGGQDSDTLIQTYNRLKSYRNCPRKVLNAYQPNTTNCDCKINNEMKDEKTFLQKLAAFFGFKAELSAIEAPQEEPAKEQEEPTKEPTELEKAQALLEANGFAVNKQEAEQVSEEPTQEEEPAPELEADPAITELQAQLAAMQNQLKDLKFKNADTSAAKVSNDKKEDNKLKISKDKAAAFDLLASLIKS